MKKILITLLISLQILSLSSVAFANEEEGLLEEDNINFEVPFTPKPDLLIGPELKKSDNSANSEKVVRGDKVLIEDTIPKIAVRAIGWLGGVALIAFIIIAIKYFTSYAQEDTHTKAKEQMIYIIAGILIAMMAFTIVSIIINLNFSPGN